MLQKQHGELRKVRDETHPRYGEQPASLQFPQFKCRSWDFPGGPVVKNPPCNVGDLGSLPWRGTKTPHATERLSHNQRLCAPQQRAPELVQPQINKYILETVSLIQKDPHRNIQNSI